GRGGLADWAQFITAGITVGQLPRAAASAPAASVPTLAGLGAWMIELFIDDKDELPELSDSPHHKNLDVRASDPVDKTVPSGRSAAAEAVLLLAELGAETERADETLTAGRLLDLRGGLLGAYRAIAERAPRGCGHGLWQAERALA